MSIPQKEIVFICCNKTQSNSSGIGNLAGGEKLTIGFSAAEPCILGPEYRPILTGIGDFVLTLHSEDAKAYRDAAQAFELGARYKLVRVD